LWFDDVEDTPGLLPLLQAVQRSHMQSKKQRRRKPGNWCGLYCWVVGDWCLYWVVGTVVVGNGWLDWCGWKCVVGTGVVGNG